MPKVIVKFLIALIICLPVSVLCQSKTDSRNLLLPSPYQLIIKAKNPYAQLNMLKDLEKAYKNSEQLNSYYESLATIYSFVGQYEQALKIFDKIGWVQTYTETKENSEIENYIPVSSIELIDTLARNTQAVFINEAHHYPAHRTFVINILERLHNIGYNYFAVETVNILDSLLNKRKYPLSRETGYYTKEPVFGELIREAIKLGYRIIPFDYEGEYKLERREKGQAENLINRILKQDPQAKILLLTGYTHIKENYDNQSEKMMAGYFRELTGIDPLTVEQTIMCEHSSAEFEHPEYRHADKRGLLNDYLSFVKQDGSIYSNSYGDLTVFHPRTKKVNKRPHWFNFSDKKYVYQLPDEVMQFRKPFLIKVYNKIEGSDAVPVDIIEVTEEGFLPLLLAEGQFTVRFIRRWDSEPFLEFDIIVE